MVDVNLQIGVKQSYIFSQLDSALCIPNLLSSRNMELIKYSLGSETATTTTATTTTTTTTQISLDNWYANYKLQTNANQSSPSPDRSLPSAWNKPPGSAARLANSLDKRWRVWWLWNSSGNPLWKGVLLTGGTDISEARLLRYWSEAVPWVWPENVCDMGGNTKNRGTWRIIPWLGYVVNNQGDRFRPLTGDIPLPNGRFMAYKWGLLTTY